jgi:hypothetical protein
MSADVHIEHHHVTRSSHSNNTIGLQHQLTCLLLLLLLQEPGTAPWLSGLFAYNYSALPSLGLSGSALSGMKAAMPKLISGE